MQSEQIAQTTSPKFDPLLALRGVACLLIVVAHCRSQMGSVLLGTLDVSWLFINRGAPFVWVFFCLSGYLVGKVFYCHRYRVNRAGIIRFWCNRALRIAPLYYFVVLVTLPIYPHLLTAQYRETLIRLLTFTYHPYATADVAFYNAPLWAVSTEVNFYLVAPLIYFAANRWLNSQKRLLMAYLSIFLGVFLWKAIAFYTYGETINQIQHYYQQIYAPLWSNLDVFLCGFLVNPLILMRQQHRQQGAANRRLFSVLESPATLVSFSRNTGTTWSTGTTCQTSHPEVSSEGNGSMPLLSPRQQPWSKGLAASIAIGYLGLSAYYFFIEAALPVMVSTTIKLFVLPPLLAIATAYFIFLCEFDHYHQPQPAPLKGWANIIKHPRPYLIARLGVLSYGIYVWHFPVMLWLNHGIGIDQQAPAAFLQRLTGTLFFSVLIASATHMLVERPCARYRRYLTPKTCPLLSAQKMLQQ